MTTKASILASSMFRGCLGLRPGVARMRKSEEGCTTGWLGRTPTWCCKDEEEWRRLHNRKAWMDAYLVLQGWGRRTHQTPCKGRRSTTTTWEGGALGGVEEGRSQRPVTTNIQFKYSIFLSEIVGFIHLQCPLLTILHLFDLSNPIPSHPINLTVKYPFFWRLA